MSATNSRFGIEVGNDGINRTGARGVTYDGGRDAATRTASATSREPAQSRKLDRSAAWREMPRGMRSMEDRERFEHEDLQRLSDLELRREGARARCGLADAADHDEMIWWCSRLDAVSFEIRRRRTGDAHAA